MEDKVIVGFQGNHNAGITIYNKGQYIVIELERLFNIKNAAWCCYNPFMNGKVLTKWIVNYIKSKYNIDEIDVLRSINSDWMGQQVGFDFNIKDDGILEHNQVRYNKRGEMLSNSGGDMSRSGDTWCAFHHKSHAAGTFYQSPFTESLVFSFDGGGDDGWNIGYYFDRNKPHDSQIKTIHWNFHDYGNPYFYLGYFMGEIEWINDYGKANLTYPGKIMGLCSYGNVRDEWVEPIKKYYKSWYRDGWLPVETNAEQFISILAKETGLDLVIENPDKRLQGAESADLAATSQHVFELLHFEEIKPYIDEYKTNVCLTGGCGMNILYNTKVRQYVKGKYNKDVFVSPNSSDCGLATGLVLDYIRPSEPVDITYAGEEVYDIDSIFEYAKCNKTIEVNYEDLVDNIFLNRHIYGLMQGNYEHGPRALGNRSIICSPGDKMKDILNDKVKHREWYRPFAPVVRLEDVSKYFNWEGESRHMCFAATVREQYREQLSSITHHDNTARIQTVTKDQNEFLYTLLTNVEKKGYIPVLLNTSFNVAGKPILNTYKDAVNILHKEQLTGIIVLNKYFPQGVILNK